MKKFKINTDFKIQLSIIVLSLFILIGILSYQFSNSNFHIISTIIGFLIIAVAIFSFTGLYNSIKNIRKPITIKKMYHIIVTALAACLILYIIVENIINAIKKFI
jgi:protein-S-isoprenylcysteine O-methyltransferase Ste14